MQLRCTTVHLDREWGWITMRAHTIKEPSCSVFWGLHACSYLENADNIYITLTQACAAMSHDFVDDLFYSSSFVFVIMPEEEQPKVSNINPTPQPLLYSQAWFEMVSWYYHSSPSSCILLLCSMDQSVSPVMLLPAQSILDSAYINTQCLTNRLRSFNWITRSAAFPLVRLGGSGHGADSPPLSERGIWFAILPNDLQMPDVWLVEWRWHGCLLVHDSVIRVGAKSTVRALKCLLWSSGD